MKYYILIDQRLKTVRKCNATSNLFENFQNCPRLLTGAEVISIFSPGTGALGYRARTPPFGTEMGTCGPSSRSVPLAEWPGRSIGVIIPGVPGLDMVAEVCISSASPQISECQQSSDTASRERTLSSICDDISTIHQSVGGSCSSESWRWALGWCSSSSLLGSDDFLVWYHCQSASHHIPRGGHTSVLDRIRSSGSRISSSIRSPNLEIGKTAISPVTPSNKV